MALLTTFHGNAHFVQMLIDAKVEFLVVGGVAVVFYKCRNPETIDDLDLLLNPSAENVERFINTFPNLEKCFNLEKLDLLPPVSRLARPNLHIPFKFDWMLNIDVFTPLEDVNFDELFRRSECASLNGSIPVPVISLQDLVERKRRDVRMLSKEKKKHEDDLRCLEARQGVKLQMNHGTC